MFISFCRLVNAVLMLWCPMVTARTAFGTSMFERVNTLPGVCGAIVAVAAAMVYAE